jgi:leucyl/phenylalanyl-tRNA---protein transferase
VLGADPDGPVAIGGDLEPGTLLAAYRSGLFPMPLGRRGRLGWWSPDPRAILPVDAMHVSRSLQRSLPRFELRVDTAFDDVVAACGDRRRPHGWITPEIAAAYRRLFDLGWAHSVETWVDGQLAGGVYGVSIGAFFAGESMFHHVTDASKAALHGLVQLLGSTAGAVLDVQWSTEHLSSLGAVEITREDYLDRAQRAMGLPAPDGFTP